MEEEMNLTEMLLEKLQFTFDYDGLSEEDLEEAREEGIEEGKLKIEKEFVLKMFKTIYPNEDTEFLNNLSFNQYTKIFNLLLNIWSARQDNFNQIKGVCL